MRTSGIVLAIMVGGFGCGDDGGGGATVDAPTPDAALDAVPDDALTTVTARVTLNAERTAGLRVVVHDPSGTPVSTMLTAADADPVLEVPAGGMVTVIEPTGYRGESVTITGVQPGDALELPLVARHEASELIVDLTLTPHASAMAYMVSGGCEAWSSYSVGGLTNRSIWANDSCLVNGTYSLLLTGLANGSSVAWAYDTFPSSVTSLSGASTPPLPTWNTTFRTSEVTITDVPVGTTSIDSFHALAVDSRHLHAFLDTAVTLGSGTASQTLRVPSVSGGKLLTAYRGLRGTDAVHVRAVGAADALPTTVPMGSANLATLDALTLDPTIPARPTVSWSRSGGTSEHAVARIDRASGGMWSIAIAPEATSVTWPALPTDLATYAPNASATSLHEVLLYDLPGTPTPAEARQTGVRWWLPGSSGNELVDGAAYILRWTQISAGES